MTGSIMLMSLFFMGLGMLAQFQLKRKFNKYKLVPTSSGLSGKEIAEKMLRESDIKDVQVVSVSGFLSDHYDPSKKTVNLSSDVYEGTSVAAAAVAAHECGHAVQHATAYSMLTFRSKMVPVAKISTNLSQWIIMAGLGMLGFGSGNPTILFVGIILFGVSTLFSVVTLPVEFDASIRALLWLNDAHITTKSEHEQAKDALKWAAMTYVIAALASIGMLVQYVLIYLSRTRNR
jgi:uncharacterized protein